MTREEMLDRAGHYVLGEFEKQERDEFERAMVSDRELAGAVARLSARMQSLDDTVTPEPAAPDLWRRIEARLDGAPQAVSIQRPAQARRRRFVGLPPWASIAASAVVAAGLGALAGSSFVARPEPVVVALLLDQTNASPGVIVEAFADDRVRIVPLEGFDVPEGQILQVWTLPDPETGPVSLGTMKEQQGTVLGGPDLALPKEGQLYEITLEPFPGSPTGRPTGPVLVKGFARVPVGS